MNTQLQIFTSLFKGREDVFALRWEKDDRSGYAPAYDVNWDEYRLHKASGGTFKTFTNKSYAPLADDRLENHFAGREIVGIYPLLENNCSWFIVADFDESGSGTGAWLKQSLAFIAECKKYELPVYLERSRSGNGAHVWMFFDEPFPAAKSRKIFSHVLELAGIYKNSDFDRLIPNQDFHSGKGLGNLIALPLQKKAVETCSSELF